MDKLSQRGTRILDAIHRLPTVIDIYCEFSDQYVEDRKAATTPKMLKAHTKKWQALWEIPWKDNWKQDRFDKLIVSGKYDASDILRCIEKNTTSGCKHLPKGGCVSAHIMLPPLMLQLTELKHHFGVPDGIAMIQLQRAIVPDFEGMDPDLFTKGSHGQREWPNEET